MDELDLHIFRNANGTLVLTTCSGEEDLAWAEASHKFGRSADQLASEGHTIERWTAKKFVDPEQFYNKD